jgi:hypothetical protein
LLWRIWIDWDRCSDWIASAGGDDGNRAADSANHLNTTGHIAAILNRKSRRDEGCGFERKPAVLLRSSAG